MYIFPLNRACRFYSIFLYMLSNFIVPDEEAKENEKNKKYDKSDYIYNLFYQKWNQPPIDTMLHILTKH